MKLSRFDRLALILAGSLLLISPAGCASSRTQRTAVYRPQDTSYGGNPYRHVAPEGNPGYAQDEFPDFRGKRRPGITGDRTGANGRSVIPSRQNPPAAQSETELVEPPRFPVEEEPAGANAVDRRSFRETLHKKMAGLWNRRGSSDTTDETAARAPLAAGAAPSGWDVRTGDDLGGRRESANSLQEKNAITDTGLVNLDAPLEKRLVEKRLRDQKFGEQQPASRRIPIGDRHVAASAKIGLNRVSPALPQSNTDGQSPAPRPVRSTSESPPEWTGNRLPGPTGVAVSERRILPSGPSRQSGSLAPGILTPGAEPVRVVDLPRLNIPPSGGDPDSETEATPRLAVSRMVLCRQVRGYDDVVEIHPQHLRRGQPILVYASLDNFLSIATATGYRTLTVSTLEIQDADGDVVLRMPLGTAIDLSDIPRQDFFLTHRVTIPENLPVGDYVFDLRIDDLQAHESSRSQIAVAVTADRTRPDGTGDTSRFATRPDSFQR